MNALKEAFREWYGSISVERLTMDKSLIRMIHRIESKFSMLAI